MGTPQLQIFTITDGEGTNCAERALAALSCLPRHRAVIGSLLIHGCRDLRTGHRVAWSKPWGHHLWLIEPDGAHYDPSACNLADWERVQEMELPRPWEQLTAGVIESHQEQARMLRRFVSGQTTLDGMPDAIYIPGLVFSSDVEEVQSDLAYVTAWGRLASESVKAGGWNAQQLEEAMGRVESMLAGPPRIRSTGVPMHRANRPKRSAHGFGREVA